MADEAASKLRITRLFFSASLACVLLVAVFAVLKSATGWSAIAGATLATGALAWWLIGFLSRRGWPFAWFLGLGIVNLFIVVPEMVLRQMGFHYESGITFGSSRPDFVRYEADEKLFWKLTPGIPEPLPATLPRVGANTERVNSWGFIGREPKVPKPPGTYRALFLGDSCTQQGYPNLVETLMNSTRSAPARRVFESVSLAIAGYSSHQGRVLAETYGAKLEPDAVFVYYGWNDHWRAYDSIDADKVVHVDKPSGFGRLVKDLYSSARVLQGVNKLVARKHDAVGLDRSRVPPERYRENLTRIKQVFDPTGAQVIFITAPTSMYQLGAPAYMVELHFVESTDEAITLHRQYNQIVREVAAQTGAKLLDLEAEIDEDKTLKPLFLDDRIHFRTSGLSVLSRRIADFADAELLRPPAP